MHVHVYTCTIVHADIVSTLKPCRTHLLLSHSDPNIDTSLL